ncbi:hypothetical protein KCMC57_up63120 [Kitasatospora sp. CMC57]|uniref:Uncharacterized protein n=1 Tax=Kitasatospora sp. CMC57 TaxID=3231513 RepID=A0AB33KEP9_9ACTN
MTDTFTLVDDTDSENGDTHALTGAEQAALEQAAATGERTADWIRDLAARWPDAERELADLADTLADVMARIDPAGEGEIDAEAHYDLTARLRHTVTLPAAREHLTAAERVALVAADSPIIVLGDFDLALPCLCEAIDDALNLARTSA